MDAEQQKQFRGRSPVAGEKQAQSARLPFGKGQTVQLQGEDDFPGPAGSVLQGGLL